MAGLPDNNSKPFPAPSPGWPPGGGYPSPPPGNPPIVPPNPDTQKPSK
jgi:hypothetical protein